MLLRFGHWRFEVDVESTRAYSQKELTHRCDCGYCRNFYQAVDDRYPNLRPFLARFGIEVQAPEELVPFEPTEYQAAYTASGTIETAGELPIRVDGLAITAEPGQQADVNSEQDDPYFVIWVNDIQLPWVLEEPPDEVLSPANEPSFIQKIVNRFLNRT